MTARNTSLTIVADPGADLGLYYQEVARFPLLSREEEQELARRWWDGGEVEAAHRLVTSNLRFVIKVAREYRQYGFRLLDLVQEGNVGLMRAVHKFNPYKGFRLITYAVWWIRAHIHDFILRSWSLVRIGTTRTQRRLFNHLQSAQKRLKARIGRVDEPSEDPFDTAVSDRQIAKELDVDVAEVTELRRRVQVPDVYLEDAAYDDGAATLKDGLADERANQEEALGEAQAREELAARLETAIAALPDRERQVIGARLLTESPKTLQALGDELGVSKERVRQIESRAKERLREALSDCTLAAA